MLRSKALINLRHIEQNKKVEPFLAFFEKPLNLEHYLGSTLDSKKHSRFTVNLDSAKKGPAPTSIIDPPFFVTLF